VARVIVAPRGADTSVTPGEECSGIAPESEEPQSNPAGGGITLRFHNAETRGWSDFSHGTPVPCHHRIDSQQSHALNRCLRDKNPVEGILMNGRQAVDGEGMFAGDG
jgi:hypothetical protein